MSGSKRPYTEVIEVLSDDDEDVVLVEPRSTHTQQNSQATAGDSGDDIEVVAVTQRQPGSNKKPQGSSAESKPAPTTGSRPFKASSATRANDVSNKKRKTSASKTTGKKDASSSQPSQQKSITSFFGNKATPPAAGPSSGPGRGKLQAGTKTDYGLTSKPSSSTKSFFQPRGQTPSNSQQVQSESIVLLSPDSDDEEHDKKPTSLKHPCQEQADQVPGSHKVVLQTHAQQQQRDSIDLKSLQTPAEESAPTSSQLAERLTETELQGSQQARGSSHVPVASDDDAHHADGDGDTANAVGPACTVRRVVLPSMTSVMMMKRPASQPTCDIQQQQQQTDKSSTCDGSNVAVTAVDMSTANARRQQQQQQQSLHLVTRDDDCKIPMKTASQERGEGPEMTEPRTDTAGTNANPTKSMKPLASIFMMRQKHQHQQPKAATTNQQQPKSTTSGHQDQPPGSNHVNNKPVVMLPAFGKAAVAAAQQSQLPTGKKFTPTAVTLPLVQYDPVEHACWAAGSPAPFMHLVHTFAAIDATTKRLEIGNALTNMYRSLVALSPQDVVASTYLLTGKIGASHEPGGEMNIGGSTVAAAVREVTGVTKARMGHLYSQFGDLGDVAQACKRSQVTLRQPPALTICGVLTSLRGMGRDTGPGSAGRRLRVVSGLLRSCRSDVEMKYLVRLLIQNLRVGANWKSIVGPLAKAVTVHREGTKAATKARLDAAAAAGSEAYHLCPSWDVLVPALLEGGVDKLKDTCAMVPGVPVKPQLARICEGVADSLKILGPGSFLAEYKYDGRRAQIHLLQDGTVKIFSRNSEDSTSAFPDVCQLIRQAAGAGAVPQHHHHYDVGTSSNSTTSQPAHAAPRTATAAIKAVGNAGTTASRPAVQHGIVKRPEDGTLGAGPSAIAAEAQPQTRTAQPVCCHGLEPAGPQHHQHGMELDQDAHITHKATTSSLNEHQDSQEAAGDSQQDSLLKSNIAPPVEAAAAAAGGGGGEGVGRTLQASSGATQAVTFPQHLDKEIHAPIHEEEEEEEGFWDQPVTGMTVDDVMNGEQEGLIHTAPSVGGQAVADVDQQAPASRGGVDDDIGADADGDDRAANQEGQFDADNHAMDIESGAAAMQVVHSADDLEEMAEPAAFQTAGDTAEPAAAQAAGSAPVLVLDAEVVGVEREESSGRVLRFTAFQELASRARKDVDKKQVSTAVCVFVFDLLYYGGETLLRRSLRERLSLLPQALPHMRPGYIEPATHVEIKMTAQSLATASTDGNLDKQPKNTKAKNSDKANGQKAPARKRCDNDKANDQAVIDELEDDESQQEADQAVSVEDDVDAADPQEAEQELQPDQEEEEMQLDGNTSLNSSDDGQGLAWPLFEPLSHTAAEKLLLDLMLQAAEAGTEGLMLKRLDGAASTYEPSKRSDAWVKLKRDYCEGLRDSLDLVVIGAWQGQGRKVAWLSPFLLAAWDPDTEQLQSVCRCISGFTDVFYQQATERLMKTRLPGPKPYFNTAENCEFWFEPKEVWEIRGAELSLSPVHRAATGRIPGTDRGLALRFPRFISVRSDKSPEDATGPDTLKQMYMAQQRRVAT